MARYPSGASLAFGPGGITPAVKILIITNVVAFVLNLIVGNDMTVRLGFSPQAVLEQLALWQPFTYMFLHSTSGVGHILFNMLALWMFGTELERTWGTRFFAKYYVITGVGAAMVSMLLAFWIDDIYYNVTVGASGAIYGLLLAYGMYFPNRPIMLYFIFPIPARIFVMIVGAIAFLSSLGGPGGGVAHSAHLGGLLVGYLYLKGLRSRPMDEIKYRYMRWKMGRARSKFDVYSGGRSDDIDEEWKKEWKKHIH
ncbi:MAG TPA: rhomboid family intramembrane serine protease [Vicinamibacterales bacterium]|nr:rhomboid family intramembrane serine protease [Vicinamibacterales bacterium]